jgi:hypothetical protein
VKCRRELLDVTIVQLLFVSGAIALIASHSYAAEPVRLPNGVMSDLRASSPPLMVYPAPAFIAGAAAAPAGGPAAVPAAPAGLDLVDTPVNYPAVDPTKVRNDLVKLATLPQYALFKSYFLLIPQRTDLILLAKAEVMPPAGGAPVSPASYYQGKVDVWQLTSVGGQSSDGELAAAHEGAANCSQRERIDD